MKLCFSPTSPYVRKVSVSAIELGLDKEIEKTLTLPDPWTQPADLNAINPLGRVPALTTDDGAQLYDSVVICEYLDSLSTAHTLFPGGDSRWQVLRQHALMHGVLDASVAALIERVKRPPEVRWEGCVEAQMTAVRRALAVAANDVDTFDDKALNIAQITAAVALGYLDFRFADDLDWRGEFPPLADWYRVFSQRESMQTTVPKAPQ